MNSDSFLPRLQSVFYSVFDIHQGPKIVYQVPESLIGVSENLVTPTSPVDSYRDRSARSTSSGLILFHFDDVSKYVIPHSQLCGRLVTCSTKNHRVIGFPVELRGSYDRNYFRFNLCFVFDRSADFSCYEPIVRKVSRVLCSCEKESGFLSNAGTSAAIHAILEQLYEDLNSYAETSIPINKFNSIELKIFPFYPNPPEVKDWMVPIALINITKRVEDNWDLTMVKVCKFIDGTNHVSRIAYLADCDIVLTRQAISHLLFYQVIMTIDIFQYSNMYTLSNSIQWLADEAHVRDECGPYVTKPGHSVPDWPKLLRLYSRFKPGKTVLEWMEAQDIHLLGVDVRRFTSFGVIKGFLRRVHRYPTLLPPNSSQVLTMPHESQHPPSASVSVFGRPRGESMTSGSPLRFPPYTPSPPHADSTSTLFRGRSYSAVALHSSGSEFGQTVQANSSDSSYIHHQSSAAAINVVSGTATYRARRASAAEKVLEQLRNRSELQKPTGPIVGSPRTSWIHTKDETTFPLPNTNNSQETRLAQRAESRRQSLIAPIGPPPSPVLPKPTLPPSVSTTLRSRSSWPHPGWQLSASGVHPVPPEFLVMLNGEHHTDELSVRFEAAWPILEKWLAAVGGAADGDLGRVSMILR